MVSLDIKGLQAFVAVAEELHFGRAAERLHLAQPPLSHRISVLERSLATQLFERTTRSVSLTSAGVALLEPARRILRDIDEAEALCRAAGTGTVGRLRIGFAGPSSHRQLPRLTRAIREAYPQIELVLVSQTYAGKAVELVASGDLDLAFARLPVDRPDVAYQAIGREELVCAIPGYHPLAEQQSIAIADLAGEPFVTLPANVGSTLRDVTISACYQAGFHPKIVQEAPDSYTVLALVAAGVGVTLTLTSVSHVQQEGIAYRPVDGDVPALSPVLVWRTDDDSPVLQRALDLAKAALPARPQD